MHTIHCRRAASAAAIASLTGVVAGIAAPAAAQSVMLTIEADRSSASPGEVVSWTVSASHTGFADPTAYFGGFIGDLIADNPTLAVAQQPVGLLSTDSGENTINGASIEDIAVNNLALLGTDDPSNPIPIFTFETLVTSIFSGSFGYDAVGRCAVHPDNGELTQPEFFFDAQVVSDRIDITAPVQPMIEVDLRDDTAAPVNTDSSITWTLSLDPAGWDDPGASIDSVSGLLSLSDPGLGVVSEITALNGATVTATPIDAGMHEIVVSAPDGQPWGFTQPTDILEITLDPEYPGSVSCAFTGQALARPEAGVPTVPVPFGGASESVAVGYAFRADRLLQRLRPSPLADGGQFGIAVDIGEDAIVVGASSTTNSTGGGAVHLFTLTGHHLGTLPPNQEAHVYGQSVAIDGSRVAVGAPGYASLLSFPRAFVFDITDPTNPVRLLHIRPTGDTAFEFYGTSIALRGNLLAVGAPDLHRSKAHGAGAGSIYLYDRPWDTPDGETPEPISRIVPHDGEPRDNFSWSFDIEGDLLLSGAWNSGGVGSPGAAYLYDISDLSAPTLLHKFEPAGGESWRFGRGVALGETWCAIASQGGSSVTFYDLRNPASPVMTGSFSLGTDGAVRVKADGHTAVVRFGSNAFDLYRMDKANVPVLVERIVAHEPMQFQTSWSGLAIRDDVCVYGIGYDPDPGPYSGSVQLLYIGEASGCNPADLGTPFGVLDLSDIVAFIDAFTNQSPDADLQPDGLFDLADLTVFIDAFTAACP